MSCLSGHNVSSSDKHIRFHFSRLNYCLLRLRVELDACLVDGYWVRPGRVIRLITRGLPTLGFSWSRPKLILYEDSYFPVARE